jgi:hypothetical protein
MTGKQRVSCASLCRIQNEQGRYLLALNQQRLLAGRRVLMPLGGALAYDDPTLPARFDAQLEKPGVPELRLYIPAALLDPFRMWFLSRSGRETDPFRELREELVDELGALPTLQPDEVRCTYLSTCATQRITDRPGVEGEVTHYWLEIFEVDFVSAGARDRLRAEPPGLRWVTADEIRLGFTEDGVEVSAAVLLNA